MDGDDLASEYDVIVLGTGLTECILAAAAARVGKTVLHMDRNDYYGGDWATFNFEGMKRWIFSNTCERVNEEAVYCNETDFNAHLKEGEKVYATCSYTNIRNVKDYYFVSHQPLKEESVEKLDSDQVINNVKELESTSAAVEDHTDSKDSKSEGSEEIENGVSEVEITEKGDSPDSKPLKPSHSTKKVWFKEDFDHEWRKFNLDLSPKLLFSRGRLVDLLISSNIARYAEFKCISRVLTYLNGKLEQVPCSRADVFSTKHVTIVEKRMLMKFLTFCAEYTQSPEEYKDFEDQTFLEFLKSRKMTSNVIHYILYSIAMVDETASTLKGLEATQQFLKSLGHYGNTPFLWPLYGSGELPQCFCRLCAVFGGVYYLKRKAEALVLSPDDKCVGIISNNKRIDCKHLIAEASYVVPACNADETLISKKSVSRAIMITNQSLLKSEKEQLTFLRLPPSGENELVVTVIELGPASCACPNGLFVVHLSCESVTTAEEDLKPAVTSLFQGIAADDTRPKVLWALYFNISAVDVSEVKKHCGADVVLTLTSNRDVDFDHAVIEAKNLFQQTFPEEEFLPRAPDPEEIKIDDVQSTENEEQQTEASPSNEPTENKTMSGGEVGETGEQVVEPSPSNESMENESVLCQETSPDEG